MTNAAWQKLGSVAPNTLLPARLELHYLAQVAAAAGNTLLEAAPDDSHPNLGWVGALGALAGRPLPGPSSIRAGLRLHDRALLLIRDDDTIATEIASGGQTLAALQTALADALRKRGIDVPSAGLSRPAYELPASPLASGAALQRDANEGSAELAAWFHNADLALGCFSQGRSDASDVRCWPHHFDIATLVAIETGPDEVPTRTVGLGMSPGDETVAAPYFYVSPWPYPDPALLGQLQSPGRWHDEGFVAALLPATELLAECADADSQVEELVGSFLSEAFEASVRSLEG